MAAPLHDPRGPGAHERGRDPSARPGRLGVGIVGAGRVGATLGAALRGAGHAVVAASAVSQASLDRVDALLPGVPVLPVPEVVERSELVLVAVPDDALGPLVAGLAATGAWQGGQLVVHTAGRWGTSVLAPVRAAGAIPLAVHPAMTFTGTSLDLARLRDAVCAVTADTAVLPVAQALVVELGAEPVVVAEGDRALYHAGLSHGANHLVTLVAEAAEVLGAAGVESPARMLEPLLRAALDGALGRGDDALTGPVARGDAGTLAAHRAELASAASAARTGAEVPAAHRAMALATAARAVASHRLPRRVADDLAAALAGEEPPPAGGPPGSGGVQDRGGAVDDA